MKKNAPISIKDVYELIEDFRNEIKGMYATKNELLPIKLVVYGAVGAILSSFLMRVIANNLAIAFGS